jgi:hypothetical protein
VPASQVRFKPTRNRKHKKDDSGKEKNARQKEPAIRQVIKRLLLLLIASNVGWFV